MESEKSGNSVNVLKELADRIEEDQKRTAELSADINEFLRKDRRIKISPVAIEKEHRMAKKIISGLMTNSAILTNICSQAFLQLAEQRKVINALLAATEVNGENGDTDA